MLHHLSYLTHASMMGRNSHPKKKHFSCFDDRSSISTMLLNARAATIRLKPYIMILGMLAVMVPGSACASQG
jgi:hypothetical protein